MLKEQQNSADLNYKIIWNGQKFGSFLSVYILKMNLLWNNTN